MSKHIFLNLIDFCLYRNVESKSRRVFQSAARTRVFYDHAFPLCRYEMSYLKKPDRHGRLELIDITAADFSPAAWSVNPADLHCALHVLTLAGEWLVGIQAVRHVWREAGMGWLIALTELLLISGLMDAAYLRFARNRMKISHWIGLVQSRCSAGVCQLQPVGERGER